jgi:signal transduction histidine kinase
MCTRRVRTLTARFVKVASCPLKSAFGCTCLFEQGLMTIELISADAELYKLCREVVSDSPELGPACALSAVSPDAPWREADLYIWDFLPNLVLPEQVSSNSLRHIFLVDRKDLPVFHACAGVAGSSVLLKPATHTTLATFLTHAASSGTAKSLRADRDEILQCLIQTNLKLQEYDQDRTAFLARAVHDFRAPLTALSGYCALVLDEALGPLNENQKEVLRRMQHSAKRLSRMASAMFQLSVGRHTRNLPDLQAGDLRECLGQALHEILPFADEKSISISSELEPTGEGLYFEARLIEQLLINILDNACKFTPKAGAIEIRGYPYFWERRRTSVSTPPAAERRRRFTQEPNCYRIDIADSGAAIAAEHLPHIFEEYTSYGGGHDRSGGGLGLAICKMIVTQHDGRIWVNNSESGPVFSFVLPIRRSKPGANTVASQLEHNAGAIVHAE